ncbi:type VI secretion system-associated protein TagF [Rhodoblastus acidophilus]|uniref:Type VI secretion system-associated protein TagF n=1 Tax=Candidatus Rhodoblastus alkanivorans TaxID=2954117 RepID=A0ABS9Z7X9_9HYPH|nr:type VI secretion system-associated protein TagF [Candidatus Rhodoblastus alkanivorans]MCI4678283.1 type VI secretion system-associated protein TagF [Candidatus Rhodoblastus alkanivorans]MCI4683541.1 type VI secretion system-associated protein TagF [Candidatus Rhodoblastus alkanivorans]MDI4640856.1 type VI secretion system-associated protein TagF [Rhodoblastus acidophilus]
MGAGCSLFGKAPTRRDFFAVATPRSFLAAWEPWLQNAVAASRDALRDGWIKAYLSAPIWRFWLGSDILGAAAIGAIMPSMDGVGRYFPLTLVACAAAGETFDPPEVDAQDQWFEEVEDYLLATLGMREHDALLAAFGAAPAPRSRPKKASWPDVAFDPYDIVRVETAGRAFESCFTLARGADPDRAFSSSSFWWTIGGDGFSPRAFAARRLPSPFIFAPMLTGEFARAEAGDA